MKCRKVFSRCTPFYDCLHFRTKVRYGRNWWPVAPAFLPNINCLTSFFASQSQIYCGGLPAGIILHLSTDQTYYL